MRVGNLAEARFKERHNRFLVEVELRGRSVKCHLPNPGRLKELLMPGASVYIQQRPQKGRKTGYDLVAVESGPVLVSIDSRLPNRAVHNLLREGGLMELVEYSTIIPEVRVGSSRIDFLLRNGRDCYLEVKSCTLVTDSVALFPDAPTERGRRHVEELIHTAKSGSRAIILFVVQRPDARLFRPNDKTDPMFGEALRRASDLGVETLAYGCRFDGLGLVDFRPMETSLELG